MGDARDTGWYPCRFSFHILLHSVRLSHSWWGNIRSRQCGPSERRSDQRGRRVQDGAEMPGRTSHRCTWNFGEFLGRQYDWGFETVLQPGLNGTSRAWPRGRILGGTSALILRTCTRENCKDYDA